jgi:hypothetical protein
VSSTVFWTYCSSHIGYLYSLLSRFVNLSSSLQIFVCATFRRWLVCCLHLLFETHVSPISECCLRCYVMLCVHRLVCRNLFLLYRSFCYTFAVIFLSSEILCYTFAVIFLRSEILFLNTCHLFMLKKSWEGTTRVMIMMMFMLFVSMGRDCVSELQPQQPYCSSPDDIWVWSTSRIILRGENRNTRGKTCPSATLSTINTTWTKPEAKPRPRGDRPATNCVRQQWWY